MICMSINVNVGGKCRGACRMVDSMLWAPTTTSCFASLSNHISYFHSASETVTKKVFFDVVSMI